ncbi:MAG: GntR family transcriptional regulator [Bacteroidaceae bacterium]|nr:GntR family transcriptional regulator [Bacteroidaceae bacterium]
MAIELGKYNKLKIVKEVDFGLYLDGGEEGEILLPARYVPYNYEIGQEIEVFIYLDNEERLVATTLKPYVQVGEFAYLQVSWVNQYGAFLDWGLMKDLFCPFREQKRKMEVGRSYIIHTHIDNESFRIVASSKVEKFLSTEKPPYAPDDEVNLLVWQHTNMGYKVIIDNKYQGLVYDNQVFRDLEIGDSLKGYIMQVREDGKVDVALQRSGRQQTLDFADTLLKYMERNGGRCYLHDKSPAEEIYDRFKVSKKVFKKAVGDLYKRRLIEITDHGLQLK